jgi:4-hydroxybenzoate polyprenyltransferase
MGKKVWRKVFLYASFVKIEHSLFALPLAWAAAFLAGGGWPGKEKFGWITLGMVAARSAALAINRLADREIDALNPRTRHRELPAGRITVREARAFALAFLALLGLAAARLNPLCLKLYPLAVAAILVYPYAKRFTWTCHYWMVPAQFLGPFGGWIGVTGEVSPPPVILGLAVGLWIAGADIIYSLQDLEFDRRHGIRSLPARFGEKVALSASLLTHLLSLALFLLFPLSLRETKISTGPPATLGTGYLLAFLSVAILILWQHRVARQGDPSRLAAAFNANLAVGPLLLAGVLLDLWSPVQ